MITEESLCLRYKEMGTVDLLEIIAKKEDYTELAVLIASEELKYRRVPDEEIKNYHSVNPKVTSLTENNISDLAFYQKVLFFIVWIPKIRGWFTRSFQSDGYVLKNQQASYYSIIGFIVFFSGLTLARTPNLLFFVLFVVGFILTYLFDILFNKERQLKQMQIKITQGKSLWW